jgi:hypothetical protein
MSVEVRLISDTTPTTAVGAAASAANFDNLDHFDQGLIVAELVGATGGTLDIYLQVYEPLSKTWYDYLHFPQLLDGAAAIIKAVPVTRVGKWETPITIGKNATPALAGDSCIGGDFGERMRAWYVPGATTTVGAAVKIKFIGTKLTR